MRELIVYTILAFLMTQCPLEEHRFIASVDPSVSGSVNPDTAYYRDGVTIEINAVPEKGWIFTGWEGDTTTLQNPLVFTINSDIDLKANFKRPLELAQSFFDTLRVSDAQTEKELFLGMKDGATNGFDPEFDLQAPTAPSTGSFYAYFEMDNYNLRGDMRPVTNEQVIWKLAFSAEEARGRTTIRWNFIDNKHSGMLRLVDDPGNPTFEVDMKSTNKYQVRDTTVGTLYIVSN